MCILTAVLFSAHNSLSVLNGDTSLSIVHKNDESDHSHIDDQYEKRRCKILARVALSDSEDIHNIGGESCHDTRKEDNGDTVSDTALVYQVSKENDEV